ncbi:hypothetical protein DF043_06730 [Burkholderia cepacia]|nr:hypothetical protein DF043_06730 [Burkholderia cepacia]
MRAFSFVSSIAPAGGRVTAEWRKPPARLPARLDLTMPGERHGSRQSDRKCPGVRSRRNGKPATARTRSRVFHAFSPRRRRFFRLARSGITERVLPAATCRLRSGAGRPASRCAASD